MSRQRVVKGTDERGRPKATWADPEPDTARGYGHMEPAFTATIERRKATPEELEAARAREAEASHLVAPSLGRPSPAEARPDAQMQASRQRGAERHVEVMAARKPAPAPEPPPEEEIVSEPRADHAESIPELDVVDGLDRIAEAANEARQAWSAKVNADATAAVATEAWERAREALATAYQAYDGHVTIVPIELVDALEAAVAELESVPDNLTSTNDVKPTPIGGGPAPRRNAREPRTEGLTARQSKAIELMQAGKTRADIARKMGTTYQTVDGLFEAAAKKKLLPIELLPLLPARFAKYTGV